MASPAPASSTSGGQLYDVSTLTAYVFYGYDPSLGQAIIAITLFTAAAAVIAFLLERAKAHRFMHTMSATGLFEAAGYGAMIYCIAQSGKSDIFGAYVTQQVFVILSPNAIQATQYMTVGAVLRHSPALTNGRKLLRGWVIATIFACSDLAAVIIQAIGISIWATSQSSGNPDSDAIRLGCSITLAGLAIQLLCSGVFLWLAIWVHRHPRNALVGEARGRRLFRGLYVAFAFLAVRNVFRFVEFTQATVLTWPPPDSAYVLSHSQLLFWLLDTLPILLCFLSYIIWHPSRLLPPVDALPSSAASVDGDLASQPHGKFGQPHGALAIVTAA